MQPNFHCSIIYNSQDMENNPCPLTDGWICIYVPCILHMYICNSATKKNGILISVTTKKDPGSILLYEVSQREKDKYYIISLTCGILKDKTNKQNKYADTENRLVVIRGKEGWEVDERVEGQLYGDG